MQTYQISLILRFTDAYLSTTHTILFFQTHVYISMPNNILVFYSSRIMNWWEIIFRFRLWNQFITDTHERPFPEAVVRRCSVKNFAKFTGKHQCQSVFSNKVTAAHVLSCEFCEIFKNTFFYRTPMLAASAFPAI